MTIKTIPVAPADEPPVTEPEPEPKTTVKDLILDLGDTLVSLKKKGISETNATKLIDVALGFHLATATMRQQEPPFPFLPVNTQEG